MTVRQVRVERPGAAADDIAAMIVDQPARLIRIEGHSTAGKSSLAKQLARVLGGIHVETDVYFGEGNLQAQLIENLAQYVASGLYVILEGVKLEERCPSVGVSCFRIFVASEFEDPRDAIRPAEIAAELGVDRYIEQHQPRDRSDVEVVVSIPSHHAELVSAAERLEREIMTSRHIEDLKPAALAVAERFAGVVAEHHRTMPEGELDPEGVDELEAAGLLVHDRHPEGSAPTVSLTDAGVMAVSDYWLSNPTKAD